MDIVKLFACCVPVKGHTRSIICDIQRMKYHFIPNTLYEILINHENKSLAYIKEYYGNEHDETIEQYFTFLLESEYAFVCQEKDIARFPKLNLSWQSPSLITNCIIDLSEEQLKLDFSDISKQLDEVGCNALQIRCYQDIKLENIAEILKAFSRSRLKHIDVLLKFNPSYTTQDYEPLFVNNPRLFFLTLHSANENIIFDPQGTTLCVHLTTKKITSAADCGCINPSYFSPNIATFTEAQNHNSCLNRKISIDSSGNIKNCPSMNKNYGSIRNTTLKSIAESKSFKELWNLNKDKISVCRDCEFRYICTDCRVFKTDDTDIYSKPAKCSYDPYTATWAE
ncbi:SPASM domain peptide maturase, grasp-with-spasm system [Chitinophaga terrae (ex Kim and Jung 2007)]|uniref:SPASM domain peptide maturase, grasp-with-spasm system n=1 Tax=Chitinophaga terrae (ex Kim and Jung 2007) TaxID=408074 RepID=A0A1H3X288_9BACT|nr:grasp-with-spasm system SPASM domain peptide maturase [Chitinophaga terrae (ex Kim and Jung 2007)]SDZ93506.1 SPASM domain peptide maturase, grasp-with-spasm system [Chitinophaga terrae (ex Kim and Jung 2007)]